MAFFVFLSTAAAVSAALVLIGGPSLEVWLFAAPAGAAFGDLARRGWSEPDGFGGDVTDWLTSLGFLAILLAASYDLGRQISAELGLDSGLVHAAGSALVVFGVILRHRAARALGNSFSVRLGVQSDQRLIEAGPYRHLRHPNYAGLLAIAIGIALAFASPFALLATLTLWLPAVCLRMAREEQLMSQRFGDAYREYQSRTSRLVPGIF